MYGLRVICKCFFFFKQKTAYEMRISDGSSDVCSSVLLQSDGRGWPYDLPPIVFEDRSLIVTRFRSGLRAASFVEFGRSDDPPDPRKWRRLHAHADALGLPIGADAQPWMGARPTLPDYLPAIGRSTRAVNLFYAFGPQHPGLTPGPIPAEPLAALVTGGRPAPDPAPFHLDRF